ncbi:metallophosphoesterase family protein [Ovoidimarina sediminis]|uniref:metallophosphoesterase family protein n=1 Tax=Ovoidimarina sediminis TaxID=3079856 RepID=UPI002910592E|nr:metallophosphoesterase [Rhodophyticola sp. MJ-SS7]MDU8946589.1 metallophosphoesterase [Rhodophyticola sp. MJ-SS7]
MRANPILAGAYALFFVSPAAALEVAVISDLNGSYGSTDYQAHVSDAVAAIVELEPDLVLVTGDMVAGQRTPVLAPDEVRAMWSAFHAAVTDPFAAAGIPVAVTPGNHDASAYEQFVAERAIYAQEWRERKPDVTFVADEDYPFFYAFDVEGVRFVSLDVTTVGPLSSGQMAELGSALDGAGDARIAFSHLPLWEFAQGRETEIIGDRDLAEAFGSLGVDLHLSGHHHSFYPGASEGIAYVSQACLGASPRRLVGATDRGPRGFTLLDIDVKTGDIFIDFRAAPDFATEFDITTLPPRIDGFKGSLIRVDLAELPSVHLETRE